MGTVMHAGPRPPLNQPMAICLIKNVQWSIAVNLNSHLHVLHKVYT